MNIIHIVKTIAPFLPRLITPVILQALTRFPVVVLTGARQTGKSTLVSMPPIATARVYRSTDDYDVLERATQQPELFLNEAAQLTIDEVQRVPELLLAIKRAVDHDRRPGRFLLTGSANLLMLQRVSESLAGRAVYLTLWPMTEAEKSGHPEGGPWKALLQARSLHEARDCLGPAATVTNWDERICTGGYPVAVLAGSQEERAQWFDGYIRTYLERDLQGIAAIAALADFRRLMRLATHRIGQMLNQTELGRDAGLTQPTTHRYLNLLETSYQIIRLSAFSVSRTKRLVKSPKLYWTDTGLAAYLAGYENRGERSVDALAGFLLENLVLSQLLTWREEHFPRPELHYWRTHTGNEVDFVIELGKRLLPIEVKRANRVRLSDTAALQLFLEEYSKLAPFGVICYTGNEVIPFTDRILAVPLSLVVGAGE
jgi:hypothetical protein